jgi:hypothetical protein
MRRFRNPVILVALVVLGAALCLPAFANHSVSVAGALLCMDGGEIEISATETSALNTAFTAQVFDEDGAALLFTGDSHTFTELDEPFIFEVDYEGLVAGVDYIISISDAPPLVTGTEGGHVVRTLRRCFLPVELESFTIE